MALAELLAALRREAEERAARRRAEARAEADRLVAEARDRLERSRKAAGDRRDAELRGTRVAALAEARQAADRRFLAARDALLERVRTRALERLGGLPVAPPLPERLRDMVQEALGYVNGEADLELRAAPAHRDLVVRLLAGQRLRVTADQDIAAGVRLVAGGGRVVVDATLEGRLRARWPELRIAVARRAVQAP